MIVVRNVFYAKYGKGDELVSLFKEYKPTLGAEYRQRILTDASGKFFTVVLEYEVESLAEWEQATRRLFGTKDFESWFARSVPLVESGYREFYNVEA